MSERTERCDNCRFWDGWIDGNEDDGYLGHCRRYPPTFAPQKCIEDYFGNSVDVSEPLCLGLWPLTDESWWCGEWQLVQPANPGGA